MASENSIITKYRRVKLAQVTAGVITTIPKIKYIALGDGGVDASGEPIAPTVDQIALTNELLRMEVDPPTFPIETTVRYSITLPRTEYAGYKFNEMALVDANNQLCAIKTMYTKQKDDDVIFTFEFDDEF